MSLPRTLGTAMRTGYRRLFLQKEDARTREIAASLRQVPLFQPLSLSALRSLAEVVHARTYRRDEVLYYEGDPGLGLYVIRSGRVRLLLEDEEGRVHELRQAMEGEVVGDESLLGDFRRSETAQAVTETQVLGFFRPDLNVIVRRNPAVGATIIGALARHVVAREVELIRLLTLRESKTAAAHLLHGAAVRADLYDVTDSGRE